MKLREYLDDTITEILQFSKTLGVNEHTIYNWFNGTVPRRINQLKIKQLTNGKVDLKDWGTNEREKKANRRVRSAKSDGLRPAQHLDVDKKAKPKSGKKGR